MTAVMSVTTLSLLVWVAFAVTLAAPVIMTALLFRDWKEGRLW